MSERTNEHDGNRAATFAGYLNRFKDKDVVGKNCKGSNIQDILERAIEELHLDTLVLGGAWSTHIDLLRLISECCVVLTKVDPAAAVAPPPDQDAPVGGSGGSTADPAAADAPPPEDAPVGGSGRSRPPGGTHLPTVPRTMEPSSSTSRADGSKNDDKKKKTKQPPTSGRKQ